MRRILSEWKQVQAEGLAMGEGPSSARGNSSDTFRLKVRYHNDEFPARCSRLNELDTLITNAVSGLSIIAVRRC